MKNQKETKITSDSTDITEQLSIEDIASYKTQILNEIAEGYNFYDEYFHGKWDYYYNLYRGIRKKSDEMADWRSNLSPNPAFGLIQQQLALIMSGIYPSGDFFALRPKSKDEAGVSDKTAEALKQVMQKQSNDMHLYKAIYWGVLDSLIYSAGIIKFEWKIDYIQKSYLDIKTGKSVDIDEQRLSRPTVRVVNPMDLVIDPEAETIHGDSRAARYIAEKVEVSIGDLKDNPAYNIDSEVNQLLMWAKECGFKDTDRVSGWEYNTPTEVAIFLGGKFEGKDSQFMVKRHKTIYKSNELPYYSLIAYPDQRSPFGLSTMEMIKDSIEYINAIVNNNADNLELALMNVWKMKTSSDIPYTKMNMFPGKVIKMDTFDELEQFEFKGISKDGYNEINMHEGFIDQVTGKLDLISEGADTTATQAKLDAARQSQKIKEYIRYNREECIVELLRAWVDMIQQFQTKEELIDYLGEAKAKEIELEDKNIDLDMEFDIELTGEATEIDRLNELDKFNMFMQLLDSLKVLPPEIDRLQVIKRLMSMNGIPEDWLVEVPQEAQEQPQGKPNDIGTEIESLAAESGVSPEELIQGLADKLQQDPQKVIDGIANSGGVQAFIEQAQGTGGVLNVNP